uniref:NADH-ubiquinone oxidoreductase chain 6 n=1 Tax=Trieres regia TaxID=1335017 RepID=A0A7T4WR26_9STRA|nr:NADH dehydrogenase subunit 6 [Odontella regia]QQD79299.1 NADH dehydrogenase subunit 6 [Odontella regia]
MITNLLFYFFSNILLLSALMVILVQNSVYSVLFLILCFVAATCILCMLECEFIALIFIIIYVGAIAILFLFVVMMLDIKSVNVNKDTFKYFPIGSFLGVIFLAELIFVITSFFKTNPYENLMLINFYNNWFDKIDMFTELESLGQIMYTFYVLQFLIAGLILLLAVIGAVSLTNTPTKSKLKSQVTFKQVSRSYNGVFLYKN